MVLGSITDSIIGISYDISYANYCTILTYLPLKYCGMPRICCPLYPVLDGDIPMISL